MLEKYLNDAESAREHRRLARRMRNRGTVAKRPESPAAASTPSGKPLAAPAEVLPLDESLIVVTGLPRAGTSMLMQMLAAGGMPVLSDGLREADEDNPRGYLEFEPVKKLLKDSAWLIGCRGKAVKIVAPLLAALPPGLVCRVILIERDLDEVLDSQDRMLARRNEPLSATPERRRLLKDHFARMLDRAKVMLARRPGTQFLTIKYGDVISDPYTAAEMVNGFLGGGLDVAKMAAAVDPALHRNRASIPG